MQTNRLMGKYTLRKTLKVMIETLSNREIRDEFLYSSFSGRFSKKALEYFIHTVGEMEV